MRVSKLIAALEGIAILHEADPEVVIDDADTNWLLATETVEFRDGRVVLGSGDAPYAEMEKL